MLIRHLPRYSLVDLVRRLLVFDVIRAEPLCKFLGKPIPSVPFPKINDKAAFKRQIARMQLLGMFCCSV